MKVSVVIPQYKNMSLLHQVLWGLYSKCRDDIDEIIIVDDFSEDKDVYDYYDNGMMIGMFSTIKVYRQKENAGFLKTCNFGVEKASGDVVVVLSNDVRIHRNFVKVVKEIIEKDEKVLIGGKLLSGDTGWNTFDGKTFPYIEGWLVVCTKKAWEELGGFDEQYGSSDFEDVDLSTKAVSLGYTLVELGNEVSHEHPASSYGYNPEREARTKRNRELFRKKWTE